MVGCFTYVIDFYGYLIWDIFSHPIFSDTGFAP